MVEIDARKFGMATIVIEKQQTALVLAKRYWFHFVSLIAIVVFMLIGYSPVTVGILGERDDRGAVVPSDAILRSSRTTWFQGKLPWARGFWRSGLIKALEGGSHQHAERRDDLRIRRHHRRRRNAHRPGA